MPSYSVEFVGPEGHQSGGVGGSFTGAFESMESFARQLQDSSMTSGGRLDCSRIRTR